MGGVKKFKINADDRIFLLTFLETETEINMNRYETIGRQKQEKNCHHSFPVSENIIAE